MQQVQEKHGYYLTDQAMRFVGIRLKSRPITRPLADELNSHRKVLSEKHENYQQAKDERLACSAEISYLDSEVDATVMELSRVILIKTKNNRDTPLFRKVFPTAPSEAMRPTASLSQEQYVLNILNRLDSDPDYQDFGDYAKSLRETQTLLKQALEQRTAFLTAEARTHVEFSLAKDEAQRFYNHTYHRLMLMLPDKRNLVESFFFTFSTKKKASVDVTIDDTDTDTGTSIYNMDGND